MNQLSMTFDYTALPSDVRNVALTRRDAIKTLERRTSESLIEIGRHLIAVKDALPHGQFGVWLEAEFGWSQDTASNFMRVARVFGQNPKISEFQSSALYALASGTVPDDIREQFIEQAERGEPVTHKQVQAALTEHKAAVTPSPVSPTHEATTVYHCGDCGEQLPSPAWHCPGCHSHWPMVQRFCLNCVPASNDAPTVTVLPPTDPDVAMPHVLESEIDRINAAGEITKKLMAATVAMRIAIEILERPNPGTLEQWAADFPNLSDAMNRVMDSAGILVGKCRSAMPASGSIRRVV